MVAAKTDTIVIVGAGAFGLSTALHLSNDGFRNITLFDKGADIPSRFSAANDLNKIVRAEYEDEFYTNLTLEAIEAWKAPVFAPHFHQLGFLHCVSKEAPQRAIDTLERFRVSAEKHPKISDKVVPIRNADDIRDLVRQYQNSSFHGWTGYFNRIDGYAHSADALRAVYEEVRSKGVRFVLGDAGAISKIAYETTSRSDWKATGVWSKIGTFHSADLVIVTAGAESIRLVPSVGKQLVAKSWSIAHIHLTDEEAAALRGIPVTYARDLGFFFQPDLKTKMLKLCPMGAGFVNTDAKTGISYVPDTPAESAFMPADDELRIRKLLSQALPSLADRPLVNKSLCWFADTRDTEFIIDYVPETSSSVVLVSGDSGHGFKMFPIVGRWVKDLIQRQDSVQKVARWRWKAIKPDDTDSSWGGAVSWRLGNTKEFAEIRPSPRAKL